MNLRLFCLLCLCLFPAEPILGGDDTTGGGVDIVYTTSGAVLRGTIIEDIPGKKVVIIMQTDSSRVEIPYKKIFKITDEANLETTRAEFRSSSSKSGLSRRVFVEGRAGFMEFDFIVVDAVVGCRMSDYFDAGFGTGILIGDNGGLPIFAAFRVTPTGGPFAPYLFAETGFAVGSAEPGDMSGIIYGAGVGFIQKMDDKHDLIIQAGVHSLVICSDQRNEYWGLKIGIGAPFRYR